MKTKLRLLVVPLVLGGGALVAVLGTSGASAADACTPTTCKPPIVKTTVATNLTATSARVTGNVNPNGSVTTCFFNYGPTANYAYRTADRTVTPGASANVQTVGADLLALQSKTTFHYQLVCTNAKGTAKGSDVTFATTDHGPSQIRLSGHTGFVSNTGMAGVFIGCYGDRPCTGFLKLFRGTTLIGQRSTYFIAANAGGIVHVPIHHRALVELRNLGHYAVSVASKTTEGQDLQGGDAGKTLTFHIFR